MRRRSSFVGAAMGYYAEHPTNPEFATFGDAIWWATVTLTTVGYGDIVPITTAGRFDGAAIMFMGVALLGLLAGSLASFFGLQPEEAETEDRESLLAVAINADGLPCHLS